MSESKKNLGADAVRVPVEATVEKWQPGWLKALLRTQDGVPLDCIGQHLPDGTLVGDRLVVEKAMYLQTLDQWLCQKVRRVTDPPPAGPAPSLAGEVRDFWSSILGAPRAAEALLAAITAGQEALQAIRQEGRIRGRSLTADEKETFCTVGLERLAEVVKRSGVAAPTHTLHRISRWPAGAARWRRSLEESARRVAPHREGVSPALLEAFDRLRSQCERGAISRAVLTAPASAYERAEHHARIATSGPARELLGLTNGFTLHDGVVELCGIFDEQSPSQGAAAGRAAGTIRLRFATPVDGCAEFRLVPQVDGSLTVQRLAPLPTGGTAWQEQPARPLTRDLPSFLTALAALDLYALRDLFRLEPLLRKALATPAALILPKAPQRQTEPAAERRPGRAAAARHLLRLEKLHEKRKLPPGMPAGQSFDPATRADLVELGRRVSYRGVIADAARIYGRADRFLSDAQESQPDLLAAAPALVSAGVQAACSLVALEEERDLEARSEAYRRRAERRARRAFAAGLKLHAPALAQAQGLLRRRAPRHQLTDGDWEAIPQHAAQLADALDALVSIFHHYMAWGKEDEAIYYGLVKAGGLSDDRCSELLHAAEVIRETAKAAQDSSVRRVRRSELRLRKGINLHILDRVIDAFHAAHAIDPRIPLLAPAATRHVLEPDSPAI